jgi:ClpA/ClpB-like protein
VSMFERFTEPASQVMELACAEAERLRHDYLGPEHVLAGLARQEDSHAAGILRASGLDVAAVQAGLDRLVAQGMLPARWRNKSDLLSSLGVDLDAVQRAVEESFGTDAVCAAQRRVLRRSSRREDLLICTNPLNGRWKTITKAANGTDRNWRTGCRGRNGVGGPSFGPRQAAENSPCPGMLAIRGFQSGIMATRPRGASRDHRAAPSQTPCTTTAAARRRGELSRGRP